MGWGAYPVLARYLQTVSHLPSLSLLGVANLLPLSIMLGITAFRSHLRTFRYPILWILAIVVASRSITNVLAARFTLAIYVQLITLLTPFIVALLSATLFRDVIPRHTGKAMVMALIGALLMMSRHIGTTGIHFTLTPTDFLGIGLALGSSLFLALYMVIIRRTAHQDIPGETVFVVQLVAIVSISLTLSLLTGEDWHSWHRLEMKDWLVFSAYSGGVFLGANVFQISALRHLGAPFVSSLLATRLIATLLFAAVLLGERLVTIWQGIGASIVFVTITWYLWASVHTDPFAQGKIDPRS